jgi:hypothetical protein
MYVATGTVQVRVPIYLLAFFITHAFYSTGIKRTCMKARQERVK